MGSAITFEPDGSCSAEHLLVEQANLLTLTAPEMTVLIGGMRALNANFGRSEKGVFIDRPETLTNGFFVNLLDMNTEWKASDSSEDVFEGRDRATGKVKWTGTAVDLVFGSNSQLRAIAEVYAYDDSKEMFVRDFMAAWDKVITSIASTSPDRRPRNVPELRSARRIQWIMQCKHVSARWHSSFPSLPLSTSAPRVSIPREPTRSSRQPRSH